MCRSTLAAVVRGSSLPTRHLDIVPPRAPDNLDRWGRALRRLGAQIRTDGDPVLTFVPAGRAGGYEGWRIGATQEEVSDGLLVVVAALDDVIDSKRAANRPKDQMALPYLESLRDELDRS